MLKSVLCVLGASVLLVAGCGDDRPPPNPGGAVGYYTVQIEANGKTDDDTMYTSVGSNNNLLLNFRYGISQVRASIAGSSELRFPRQTVHVDHSIGVADGVATGSGTIAADGT